MNKEAAHLEWDEIENLLNHIRQKAQAEGDIKFANRYWEELLLVGCACYTGRRPSDYGKWKWEHLLNEASTDIAQWFEFYERKPLNLMLARERHRGRLETDNKFLRKAKKTRVYIIPEFRELIGETWRGLGYPTKDRHLFSSERGQCAREGLTTDGVNFRIKRLEKEVGIDRGITAYSFRRAVMLKVYGSFDPNIGLQMAQQFAGHSSPLTTARYIGLGRERIQNLYEQLTFKK